MAALTEREREFLTRMRSGLSARGWSDQQIRFGRRICQIRATKRTETHRHDGAYAVSRTVINGITSLDHLMPDAFSHFESAE